MKNYFFFYGMANNEIYTAPLILYISLASISLIILYLILNY